MANANTEISLDALHQAIVADIHAQFPDLVLVQFYREEEERRPPSASELPACLLDVPEFESDPSMDPGTEQLSVQMRFEARLVLGFRTPDAKLSALKWAAAFAAWLRARRWADPSDDTRKLPTGPAEPTGASRDNFSPELDQYEVWRVEWTQTVHLGATVWKDEGATPTQVLASWSPRIGIPHVDEYVEIQS